MWRVSLRVSTPDSATTSFRTKYSPSDPSDLQLESRRDIALVTNPATWGLPAWVSLSVTP
jgi:hypothetical protein